jgi:hypothetical protein
MTAIFTVCKVIGEPPWLSGKVVRNEKINEIKRSQVPSPENILT